MATPGRNATQGSRYLREVYTRIGIGRCPAKDASYLVSVRQVAALLRTSFRRHLAITPLCFASPSPPSDWTGGSHSQRSNILGTQLTGRLPAGFTSGDERA